MFEEKPVSNLGRPRKLIFGVGINDAEYITAYKDTNNKRVQCPFYGKWVALLDRCYSTDLSKRRPNYAGCTMHEEWKTFSNFKKWMESQDWKGKHLDKDLINWDAKHYGPDTCLFISPELNNLLTLRNNHRGELPLGVSRTTIKGFEYFTASCSFYGKQKRLGYFKTPKEAAVKYKEAKLSYINELANTEKNPRIKQALLNLY